jgi:7-carboxy-7-deazaguanine synthase
MAFMYGTNPIRPPSQGDGQKLDVQQIFATIQGEGPYAGWPAIFIRLGGCNLACSFCDTEFESFKGMALEDIMARVKELGSNIKLVVITGGEPLRQPIEKLCKNLLAQKFKVQLETNGTLYRPLPREVDIICSPKNNGSGYHPIRPDLLARINAFKFIISASMPGYYDVVNISQGNIPVYVQPMDEYDEEKNKANMNRAVELSQLYGYRLSLQLPTMIGVD